MAKKEVSGELIQTFQGGVSSEKATQGKLILIAALAVIEVCGINLLIRGMNSYYYADLRIGTGLFAMILPVIVYVKLIMPFFKVLSEATKRKLEIRSDGVMLCDMAGKVLFSCTYEMLGEPTVKKQPLFCLCQIPNKYGVMGVWAVETGEKGWEICEVIRSAALQAGIKL